MSEIPELTPRPETIDIHAYEMLRWNNHFEASIDIPEVSEEIRKLMSEDFEKNIEAKEGDKVKIIVVREEE